MKIFVSWSGDKSREVAVALREWLPPVINSVMLFVSSKDIDPGTRWQMEVAGELESTLYGIVCVTRANQSNPWLNFEAGALAKVVSTGRVVPLAIDLKPSDVKVPLGQFQAQPASEDGIRELVRAINAASESPLASEVVEKAFAKWWPDLQEKLKAIEDKSSPTPTGETPERTERELLEETLNTVRSLARQPRFGRGEGASGAVPQDHPFVEQLTELLRDQEDCMILHAGGSRRLGVRSPERLNSDLREQVEKQAEVYGIGIDFMPTRNAAIAKRNAASIAKRNAIRRAAARRVLASDATEGKENSENADHPDA